MKKLILGLALATTGIAGVAIAQAPGPMGDPFGDRTITKAEAQAKAEEMFNRLDVNKDGKLDDADRAAHQAQMFERMDANKDGSVSKDEFAAAHQRKAGDRPAMRENRMGKHGMRHEMGGKMMAGMADANKDGVITREEFLAAHARMFDAADTNKDGKLTPAERKAHHAEMRKAMGAKRAAGHGDHAGHAGHGPAANPAN